MSVIMPTQSQLVLEMEKLNLDVAPSKELALVVTLIIQPLMVDRINEAHDSDSKCAKL